MLRSSQFYVCFRIFHIDWLMCWSMVGLVDCFIDWLNSCVTGWLNDFIALIDWSIDRLLDWLIDWLCWIVSSWCVVTLCMLIWLHWLINWLIYGSFDWLRSFVGADSCVTYLQRLPESHFGSRAWKCSKSASRGFLRANSGAGPRNAQNEPPEASWEPFREQSPEMLKMSLQRVPKSHFYGFWSLEVRFEQ